MKRDISSNHSITDVFVYCLMGLFALAGTLVALLGARAYRSVAESAACNTNARIPAAFVRTLVRSADAAGAVDVRNECGIDTLVLLETYDDIDYLTRIYCYNGELCTSMTEAEEPFDPFLGDSVCALGDFTAAREGELLTMELTYPNGETETVSVLLHAAK